MLINFLFIILCKIFRNFLFEICLFNINKNKINIINLIKKWDIHLSLL